LTAFGGKKKAPYHLIKGKREKGRRVVSAFTPIGKKGRKERKKGRSYTIDCPKRKKDRASIAIQRKRKKKRKRNGLVP